MDELKVCMAYRIGDKTTERFPNDISTLERVEPIYETLPGFDGDLAGLENVEDLPANARDYLTFISDVIGVPISMISTGPRREETLVV